MTPESGTRPGPSEVIDRLDGGRRRPAFTRYLRTAAFASCLMLAGLGIAAVQSAGVTFALADIHGDYASLVGVLRQAGVIDEELKWAGGDATLIQMGDFTDRGPGVRRVMDLLESLQSATPPERVRILLGNHEVMNMMGDLRYTTEADYESFRDEDSVTRRREALEEYVDFETRRRSRLGLPPLDDQASDRWLAEHPPGFVERREAFSPTGEYGQWLRMLPVVIEHNGTIFMHAGIHPQLADLSIDEINERVHRELGAFDEYMAYLERQEIVLPFFTLNEVLGAAGQELAGLQNGLVSPDDNEIPLLEGLLEIGSWLSVHPQGPMWFRGFAEWSDDEGLPMITALLDRYDVRHFVVGHTPQPGGQIVSRFGGRLYLADTGMLADYYTGGRASILRIEEDNFEAIYLDATGPDEDSPGAGDP